MYLKKNGLTHLSNPYANIDRFTQVVQARCGQLVSVGGGAAAPVTCWRCLAWPL